MRRHLAHWPDEVSCIFRMLDLIAHGADGHGPVHLLLTSAAEIGFAWDGEERVGFGRPLSLSECFRALYNISRALFYEAWLLKVSAQLANKKEFRGAQMRERDNVVEVHSVWMLVEPV